MIAGLRRAHAELRNHGIDLTEIRGDIAHAKGIADPYLRKLTSLASLAPDIQSAILEGRQPRGMTLATMMAKPIPLDWHDQRQDVWLRTEQDLIRPDTIDFKACSGELITCSRSC